MPRGRAIIMDLVRPELAALPGLDRASGTVETIAKLDANENPLTLAPEAAADLGRVLSAVPLHRYGDDSTPLLRARLAKSLDVEPAQLCFGNGSNELLRLLATVFARPRPDALRARILFPSPTFFGFKAAALLAGVEPVEVPLDDAMELDPAAMHAAIVRTRPNLVFLCRPNNPTGTLWSRRTVMQLVARHPDVLFAIDEVYQAYAKSTLLYLLETLPNIVIVRSLSKVGGAALRVGYVVADPEIVAQLERVRPPFAVSALNAAAACWLLERGAKHVASAVSDVIAERDRLTASLAELGLAVFPSRANFVLMRYLGGAAELCRRLRERGILVCDFDRPGPLTGCLRITVGSRRELDSLLDAIASEIVTLHREQRSPCTNPSYLPS